MMGKTVPRAAIIPPPEGRKEERERERLRASSMRARRPRVL